MPFVTTPERVSIRKGMRRAIEVALRAKFGEEGVGLMSEVNVIYDDEKLLALQQSIVTADSLEEVRRACAEAVAPTPPPKKKGSRAKRQKS
jgi:hypothetical protein